MWARFVALACTYEDWKAGTIVRECGGNGATGYNPAS